MAQTGTIVYSSAVLGGHKEISASGFTVSVSKDSGSWPNAQYKIRSATLKYTRRNVGYINVIHKIDGTNAGTAGSYWTGEGGNALSTTKSLYAGKTSMTVGIYGDGGYAGQLLSGSRVYVTVVWELTESASTFTLDQTSVPLDGNSDLAVSITKGVGVSSMSLQFSCGSDTSAVTITGTSYTFSVPQAWQGEVTESTSGSASVVLISYNSAGSEIGRNSKAFTVTVPASVVPVINSATAALVDGIAGQTQYIQRVSKMRADISASAQSGATITSITVAGPDMTDQSPITPAANVIKSCTSNALGTAGQNTYTVTVTDSRGRTATTTIAVTVTPYNFPAIQNLDASRHDGTNISLLGTKLYVTAAYTWTDTGVNGNSLSIDFEYREKGDTVWLLAASGTPTDYPSGSSFLLAGTFPAGHMYELRMTLQDTAQQTVHASTEFLLSISSGDAVMVIQRGATRKAVGVGAVPMGNRQLYLHDDWNLYAHGQEILQLIREFSHPVGSVWMTVGSEDPNTLFGGTWVKIENTFLYAAGSEYAAGTTGGSLTHKHTTAAHTLALKEIPQHYHSYLDFWSTYWNSGGQNRFAVAVNGDGGGLSGSSPNSRTRTTGVIASASNRTERGGTDIGQAHSHGDTGETACLPPFLAVNVWKRTA